MKLETQLAKLAELGFVLNPGIMVDDLLHSFDRAAFEADPYNLLLFMFGGEAEREPWGRRICSRVWSFDTECIGGAGDYVQIVQNLCQLTGDVEYLCDIQDHVDLEAGEAWLEYTVQGRRQRWTVEVNDDWADLMTLCYVMDDLERGGQRFFFMGSGQSLILFYLGDQGAARLSALSGQPLTLFTPD